MRIKILEPLGIPQETLLSTIDSKIGPRHSVIAYDNRCEDIPTLIERSADADILVFSNIPFPKEVLEKCHNLRFICCAFTGLDHIDLAYCQEHGIEVQNCAGYSTAAVAELTMGLALDLARKISTADKLCRQGQTKATIAPGWELSGKIFGIVGLGAIGQQVAKLAQAFGCQVIAYNRSKKNIPGIEMVELNELLNVSHIVSLHLPLTAETRGLIGKEQLELFRPDAILINTARGPIINTDDLAYALKNGWLAGAGIDVFDTEPPIPAENPLLALDNVILTPHLAFATKEAFQRRAEIAAQRLGRWVTRSK